MRDARPGIDYRSGKSAALEHHWQIRQLVHLTLLLQQFSDLGGRVMAVVVSMQTAVIDEILWTANTMHLQWLRTH